MNSKRILTMLVLFALLIATTSVAFASQDIDDTFNIDDNDDDLYLDEDLDDDVLDDDNNDDSDDDSDDDDDDWEYDDSDDDSEDDDDDDWEDDDSDDDSEDDDDDDWEDDDWDDDWEEWNDEDSDDLDNETWDEYDGESHGNYTIVGRLIKYYDGMPLIFYKTVAANGAKKIYYSNSTDSDFSNDTSNDTANATSYEDDEFEALAAGSCLEPLFEETHDSFVNSAPKSISKSLLDDTNQDDENATLNTTADNEKMDNGENNFQFGLFGLLAVLLICVIAIIYKRK